MLYLLSSITNFFDKEPKLLIFDKYILQVRGGVHTHSRCTSSMLYSIGR